MISPANLCKSCGADEAKQCKCSAIGDGKEFVGTENPRELRAIAALMRRPMPREELDREAGCSNSPELVAALRRKGLAVPCVRVHTIDRDGKAIRPGVYHFPPRDRRNVHRWLNRRGRK
jgi:hypothetical protein